VTAPRLALYSYWRSSSAWRVRIGLALKGLAYEYRAVDLRAGVQFEAAHRARNPMGQVPVLEVEEDGRVRHLAQSMAILEFLEERFPSPALLPADAWGRARVRALAEHVNAGIQPFQNQAPQKWLAARQPGLEKEWVRHWIDEGLRALEVAVADGAGGFCHGDAPGLADCYLVPQLYGARRFGVELAPFPTLVRIEAACAPLPAFVAAAAEAQPDAPAPLTPTRSPRAAGGEGAGSAERS
jgi:maleylpyruvate isomerase